MRFEGISDAVEVSKQVFEGILEGLTLEKGGINGAKIGF